MKKSKDIQEPQVGQKIYVPTSLHLSHGRDDVQGGIATITKIIPKPYSAEENRLFVAVEEHPNTEYNWFFLLEHQKEWKKRYGKQIAQPDPDYRPEFNDPYL